MPKRNEESTWNWNWNWNWATHPCIASCTCNCATFTSLSSISVPPAYPIPILATACVSYSPPPSFGDRETPTLIVDGEDEGLCDSEEPEDALGGQGLSDVSACASRSACVLMLRRGGYG